MNKAFLAQNLQIGPTTGPGTPTTAIAGPLVGIETIGDLVNKLIGLVMPLAGVILFLVLVWGGYDFLLSRGNPEKVKSAQGKITTGLIGFLLLAASFFVVKLIAWIFNLGDGIL